jgi:Protein of unknown function (DUF3631)
MSASGQQRIPRGLVTAVDGVPSVADLLDRVGEVIERFVVLPDQDARTALALFILHTWAFEAAHATPYLVIVSAEKQSGKTRLLEVMCRLVRGPWHTASASEAALFRKIQLATPTLLLDEIDTVFGCRSERAEALRAVLNAGNRRGASVTRVVGHGPEMTVMEFSVFCPKMLAGIDTGRLPETIRDRSVVLRMKRRRTDEEIKRLRPRLLDLETQPLRDQLVTWAAGAIEDLREALPELPKELSDREADAWEPLLAIADLAGGDWPARARAAAIALSVPSSSEEIGQGSQLLAVIRKAIGSESAIFTAELLKKINADEELPFGGWNDGQGLDSRTLARMLKRYGIKPSTVRIHQATAKGYRASGFMDAFERYLPPSGASQPSQPSHVEPPQEVLDSALVTDVTAVTAPLEVKPESCAYRGHIQHWQPHPRTGRTICWVCHPPAGATK